MRICIIKALNKLIEMQSDAKEGTLIQNALNAGYKIDEIEEKLITPEEWKVYDDELRKPTPEQIERQNDINANLPSWNEVSNYLDGLTTLADAKAALKKIARVVYWLAKNSKE